MAYDLEEQDQLDEIKAWWKKNGNMAINGLLAIVVAYAAWQGYHYFQNKKSVEGSALYQNLVVTDPTKTADIKTLSAKLMENFDTTPYAGRAAILAAKASLTAKDNKSAKAQLEWAVQHATESTTKAAASIQFASILFEEKNYDAALKALGGEVDPGFLGLKEDLKGDILLAQGKSAEAKKAYQIALENLEKSGRFYQYTQQKLESLGA
jgi:predicted negative regulator of RcsB-dependent stress response